MPLKIGDKAPLFDLPDQYNNRVKLSDYRGKWIILYFYPRDNTPGCTLEAKDFTCLISEFQKFNAAVIGVSKDSISSHQKFIAKQNLDLKLLSDTELEVLQDYDAWREKKMYGKTFLGVIRSTFLINPQGNIEKAWYNVKAKGHADKVLALLKEVVEK